MNKVPRKEITSNLIFILLGAGYLFYNTNYPLDTLNNPGPGLFPLILGSIFTLLAIYQLVHIFQKNRVKECQVKVQPQSVKRAFQNWKNESGPFLLAGAFAIYLILHSMDGFFYLQFFICSDLQ